MAKTYINQHPFLPIQLPYSMEEGFSEWYTYTLTDKVTYVFSYIFNVYIKNKYNSYRFVLNRFLRYRLLGNRRIKTIDGVYLQFKLYPKDFYIWVYRSDTTTNPSTRNFIYSTNNYARQKNSTN